MDASSPEQPPEVRVGSPFAIDSAWPLAPVDGFTAETGIVNELARGGTLAGWLMLPFAAPCVGWFPAGGVMIAGLGCVLSLFGCAAQRVRWAAVASLIHAVLLAVCLGRWLDWF